jgi:uncharacterized protein YqgQ
VNNLILTILFIEVTVLIGVFGILAVIYFIKRIFPKNEMTENSNQEINPFSDVKEEVYDLGYINDINDFDYRINAMKDELNNIPAVEIITDAYEAGMNNRS